MLPWVPPQVVGLLLAVLVIVGKGLTTTVIAALGDEVQLLTVCVTV